MPIHIRRKRSAREPTRCSAIVKWTTAIRAEDVFTFSKLSTVGMSRETMYEQRLKTASTDIKNHENLRNASVISFRVLGGVLNSET